MQSGSPRPPELLRHRMPQDLWNAADLSAGNDREAGSSSRTVVRRWHRSVKDEIERCEHFPSSTGGAHLTGS
jgi:hypothetical protein